MRFGSVCSGIEAASVAWHPLGWQAAWLAEIEPFPAAVLAHHYPEVPNLGDMTALPARIRAGEIEAPDVFCGGTPCQAFSVAGLRRSLDDARGNLSLTFCEIADAIDYARHARGEQPAVIFWENVPGVLSTKDNAFGCFLAGLAGEDVPLEPPGGKWTDAGVVIGPARAIAWRVLDAQYFGLAQRRKRVFVVASAREGFDPAAVLFEWEGVRRDTAPSRKAGQRVAPTIAGCANGGGANGPGRDVDSVESLQVTQPYTVANTMTARMHKGINTTLDEGQTPVLAHSLRGEGFNANEDGTGRGTPPVCFKENMSTPTFGFDQSQTLQALNFEAVAQPVGVFQDSEYGVQQYDSDGSLRAGRIPEHQMVLQPLPFDTTQITSKANVSSPKHGDPCHPLAAGAHAPAVAFGLSGEINPSIEHIGALDAGSKSGGGQPSMVMPAHAMQVRRLTPVECERLQGFPDNYTAIPWRNKPADQCPDGPRYKALGNSWAVPVVQWIGWRIATELARDIL